MREDIGDQSINEAAFFKLLEEEPEQLSLVIKSHYSIDCLLNEILEEALVNSEALEVQRVSFLLKVDFLIALGLIRDDIRGVYSQINTIRNKFAHNPYFEYSIRDSNESKSVLLSTKKPSVPSDFHGISDSKEILKNLLAVGFITAIVGFEALCRYKCETQIANELARETLGRKTPRENSTLSVRDEFKIRVQKLLNEKYPQIKNGTYLLPNP